MIPCIQVSWPFLLRRVQISVAQFAKQNGSRADYSLHSLRRSPSTKPFSMRKHYVISSVCQSLPSQPTFPSPRLFLLLLNHAFVAGNDVLRHGSLRLMSLAPRCRRRRKFVIAGQTCWYNTPVRDLTSKAFTSPYRPLLSFRKFIASGE
jgi:hypothetical protein